jgi:hypothetical protein
MTETTTPTVTTTAIRRVLKAAGLTAAKKQASTMVRGYTNVVRQGYALRNETVFQRVQDSGEIVKRHVPTGRVEVDLLLSSWHADEAQAAADLETARRALIEAGYAVADSTERQLIVSAA